MILYYSLISCRNCPPTIRKIDHHANSAGGSSGGVQHAKIKTGNAIIILGGTKNDQYEESENKWVEIVSSIIRNSSRWPTIFSTIQKVIVKVILWGQWPLRYTKKKIVKK